MRQSATALAAAFALVGFAGAVQAQTVGGGSLSLGHASMGSDGRGSPWRQLSLSLSLYRRFVAGIGVGVELGFHRYLDGARYFAGTTDAPGFWLDSRASAWRITPVVRVQPFGRRVRPYLLLGAGLYRLRTDSPSAMWDREQWAITDPAHIEQWFRPGTVLGLGVELFPAGGDLGLALGGRMHLPSGVRDEFATLEAGLAWRFGGSPSP